MGTVLQPTQKEAQPRERAQLLEYRDTIMFHKPEDLYGEFSNWYICYFHLDAVTTYSFGQQMLVH